MPVFPLRPPGGGGRGRWAFFDRAARRNGRARQPGNPVRSDRSRGGGGSLLAVGGNEGGELFERNLATGPQVVVDPPVFDFAEQFANFRPLRDA